ncbi:hypothetical protein BH11GEM2_BH11GEM2_38200 [soil metagenome]
MSDAELLRAAASAAGYDLTTPRARRGFAAVLGVEDRSLVYWLAGRSLDRSTTVRHVCRAMLARPRIARDLLAVAD